MSKKINHEIAYVSEDFGIIAETIIKKNGKTKFAVYQDGKVEFKNQLILPDGKIIEPLSESSDVIKSKFITLPPKPIPYGTEGELFAEVKSFFCKYFSTTKGFREIVALYIMLTWVYERFDDLPYLRVIGTLGTGKSRFLKTLSACTYNSMMLGSASVSAIFRTIDKHRGTFILDEANFKNSEYSSEVAKIFNNGNTKDAPVARMREKANSNGEYTTDFFQVFGPKILASRESFGDAAFESRCFAQRLYPTKNIKAPISLGEDFWKEARILRGKLLTFRFKHYQSLNIKEIASEKINNLRILQITQPLWNIALLVSQKVAQNVVEEAILMDRDLIADQSDTTEADVLIVIMRLMDHEGDKIHMKNIAEKYFKSFGRGSQMTEDGSVTIFDYKSDLSERKIGEIVGKTLHLKKFRDNKGIFIFKDQITKSALNSLCERYGITDDIIYP
jgi:hypothetical protein